MPDYKRKKQLKICSKCKHIYYTKPFGTARCSDKKVMIVYVDECKNW